MYEYHVSKKTFGFARRQTKVGTVFAYALFGGIIKVENCICRFEILKLFDNFRPQYVVYKKMIVANCRTIWYSLSWDKKRASL